MSPPHNDQRTELQLFLCIQTEIGPRLCQPVLWKKLEAETQIVFLRILYIIIPWSLALCLTYRWINSDITNTSRMKLNFKTVRPFLRTFIKNIKEAWSGLCRIISVKFMRNAILSAGIIDVYFSSFSWQLLQSVYDKRRCNFDAYTKLLFLKV